MTNPYTQLLADLMASYPLSVATLPGDLNAEYTRDENTATLTLSHATGLPSGLEVMAILDALRDLGIDTLQVRRQQIGQAGRRVVQLTWPRTAGGTPKTGD